MLMLAAGHLLPQHPPGRIPPHSGVARGRAPVAGNTPNLLPPWLGWSQPPPLASPNQSFHMALLHVPHWLEQPVGHIFLGMTFWALLWCGCSLLSEDHLMSPLCGAGWMGSFCSSASSAWSHLGHPLVFDLSLSMAWDCLGTCCPEDQDHLWSITSWWSSSSAPFTPPELQLPQGLTYGHPLWGPSPPLMSLCLQQWTSHTTVVHGSKCMRIRPRGISWQLCPHPLWLCGSPLKLETPLYWVQDLLGELLLGCLFTSASSG